jgi:hypothetical protein
MPCLSLKGVARAIAGSQSLRAKILLRASPSARYMVSMFLTFIHSERVQRPRDGRLHRCRLHQVCIFPLTGSSIKTSPSSDICISAIVRTLNHQHRPPKGVVPPVEYPASAFVTHLVFLEDTQVEIDERAIAVRCPFLPCYTYSPYPPQPTFPDFSSGGRYQLARNLLQIRRVSGSSHCSPSTTFSHCSPKTGLAYSIWGAHSNPARAGSLIADAEKLCADHFTLGAGHGGSVRSGPTFRGQRQRQRRERKWRAPAVRRGLRA